jgi:hypothetical protein
MGGPGGTGTGWKPVLRLLWIIQINGQTSVPKLELGNQGAGTDGFGEYLLAGEGNIA